ncbi:MAG: transketolase [Candidatus Omnitrophica bacterium]|nr:transketolase [Candidatus Omnitrophota bacterium]
MNLDKIASKIRKEIINVANASKSPHVGSALSCTDILVALYFRIMKFKPWQERDIFILSKAHSAMALYCVLAEKGIIKKSLLKGYYKNNGTLPAHLDRFTARGIEVSAGSLGHGFNMALGLAYSLKLNKSKRKVYCLIGDGESQEGSIWEGALFAPKICIDNFTAILDHNDLQGYGRPTQICYFEPIVDKWKAFGWDVHRINGHNIKEILSVLSKPNRGKPRIIIADTCKGKGISFMENQMKWHYFIVTEEIRKKALRDICACK